MGLGASVWWHVEAFWFPNVEAFQKDQQVLLGFYEGFIMCFRLTKSLANGY